MNRNAARADLIVNEFIEVRGRRDAYHDGCVVLLSLFLATSQYDTPDEGAEDESSGKAA